MLAPVIDPKVDRCARRGSEREALALAERLSPAPVGSRSARNCSPLPVRLRGDARAARLRCVSRPEIPRYSEYRCQRLCGGGGTGDLDDQCACAGWARRCSRRARHWDRLGEGPKLIAVTVLTSMAGRICRKWDLCRSPQDAPFVSARLARDNGLDGVVCSAREAALHAAMLVGDRS